LLFAVAVFGGATIFFGLSLFFWLSLPLHYLLGICEKISLVILSTLIQTRTRDGVRGRVSAINGLFIVASNDLGAFESGLVAAWFTPTISVVSGGIGTAVVVAMTAWLWPQLRGQGRVEDPT
jgi:hypothetical protein